MSAPNNTAEMRLTILSFIALPPKAEKRPQAPTNDSGLTLGIRLISAAAHTFCAKEVKLGRQFSSNHDGGRA